MRPPQWEDWSQQASPLRRRDPRAKVLALLIFLVCAGVANAGVSLALLAAAVSVGVFFASVPLRRFVARFAMIMPIPAVFAAVVWASGHPERAGVLISRSALSVTAILLVVTSTPIPHFFAALSWAKVPALLIEVVQFVYRYLFVLAEEVWTVRQAAASRGGSGSLVAAASGVSVLFARSYARAEAIHRAMLSRSFSGSLVPAVESRPDWHDGVLVAVTACWSIASVAAGAVR